MPAHAVIRFTKRHTWPNPGTFNVLHSEGPTLHLPAVPVNRAPVPLWPYAWQKAGFGHGRFGFGAFGWAQGGLVTGGFGHGRFGIGEFGYYNEPVEWTTPPAYRDGLHTFAVTFTSASGHHSGDLPTQTVLLVSTPGPPRALLLESVTAGTGVFRIVPSEDI